jgi:hypothetical protein
VQVSQGAEASSFKWLVKSTHVTFFAQ